MCASSWAMTARSSSSLNECTIELLIVMNGLSTPEAPAFMIGLWATKTSGFSKISEPLEYDRHPGMCIEVEEQSGQPAREEAYSSTLISSSL